MVSLFHTATLWVKNFDEKSVCYTSRWFCSEDERVEKINIISKRVEDKKRESVDALQNNNMEKWKELQNEYMTLYFKESELGGFSPTKKALSEPIENCTKLK